MTKIDIHRYDPKVQLNGSYIFSDGAQRWYNSMGQCHREDGPAIILIDGHTSWCLDGTYYPFNRWLLLTTIPEEQKLLIRLQYE